MSALKDLQEDAIKQKEYFLRSLKWAVHNMPQFMKIGEFT